MEKASLARLGVDGRPTPTTLEIQLKPKLNISGKISLVRRDESEINVSRIRIRTSEDRRIQNIECLCPELEVDALGEVEALVQRHVPLRTPWIANHVAAERNGLQSVRSANGPCGI